MMELALETGKAFAWNVNLETGELFWNERYARLLGLPPEFTPTLNGFLDLIHPEDREAIEANIASSIRNPGNPFHCTYRMVLPSGIRWFDRRGQVLCDAEGRPVDMIGITADITEEKVAEDALRAVRRNSGN